MNFQTLSIVQLESSVGGAGYSAEVDRGAADHSASCDISSLPQSAQKLLNMDVNHHATQRNLAQLNFRGNSCGAQLQAFQKYTLGRYGSYDKAMAVRKTQLWY